LLQDVKLKTNSIQRCDLNSSIPQDFLLLVNVNISEKNIDTIMPSDGIRVSM